MDNNQLETLIAEIAKEHCADYPNIETVEPWEQLYAIKSTMIGTSLACNDCWVIIRFLQEKLGMEDLELANVWQSLIKN